MTKLITKNAGLHISIRAFNFYMKYGQKMTATDFLKKLTSDNKWHWSIPTEQEILSWKASYSWDSKLSINKNPQNALEEYNLIKSEKAVRARQRIEGIDSTLEKLSNIIDSIEVSQIPQDQIIKILPNLVQAQEKLYAMQKQEIERIEEEFAKTLPDEALDSLIENENI